MELDKIQQFMTMAEQNLLFLESLIPGSDKLYVWCYDQSGAFIAASCPEDLRPVLEKAFHLLGGTEKLIRYAADAENIHPRIIGSPIGMQWALTYESERERRLMFVIGPVFYAKPLERHLRSGLGAYTGSRENAAWASELIRNLSGLPVMSYAIFTRYVMMVHNTLTGSQQGPEVLSADRPAGPEIRTENVGTRDRGKVYLAERAMLQMVRDGDINYYGALQSSILQSPGVPVTGRDPLRQMKTSIVVFTTLVCRAAMEGGLSPEIAYELGDSYIQSAEDCRDSGELSALAHAMYHDFIYRVHQLKVNPDYSQAVRKCCDYISLCLDRKIRTADLAVLVGYSEYYLTEKFRKETGESVSSYIRRVKVERAMLLLETTDLGVREIAEQLAFNTVNYFIKSFRDTAGCTPAQYRRKVRGGAPGGEKA